MILCQFPRLMAALMPLLVLILGQTTCPAQSCTVISPGGTFKGYCQSSFSQFLAIPYAEPPTGALRFAETVPYIPNPLHLVQANKLPPFCPQTSGTISSTTEDCLYLNVYTPTTGGATDVLFWIHGGSFIEGGSADPVFNGTALAQSQNVVVVTVNYRLGVLGFYDSPETGTNFGLSDVVTALKWVNNNIENFGGNPQSVTIVGQSSGATLVHSLLMTPSAQGLFTRAIIQSDPQAYSANNATVSQDGIAPVIDQSLGCATSGLELIQCLRNASVTDILAAQMNIYAELPNIAGINSVYPFGPNVDSSTLPLDLSPALAQNKPIVNPVDIIIGVVRNEAGQAISQVFGNSGISSDIYQYALAAQLGPAGAGAILSSSLFSYDINNSSYQAGFNYEVQLSDIATEYEFSCPNQLTAQAYQASSQHKVYFYEFVQGIQSKDNVGYALCSNGGVCHEDDLYAVFGTYPTPSTLTSSQNALVTEVQTRWANFAKTGNPSFTGGSTWSPLSGNNLNIRLLGGTGSIPAIDPNQCQFLNSQLGYNW